MNRIAGIDVARGLALLGMFFSHAAPSVGRGFGAFLLQVPDERSRLLFALTAGLGLGLLTGGLQPPSREGSGERTVLRKQIAIRAACLLVLGVVFQATGVLVYVILDEYGIAFFIMLPFVFLPARWLLSVGVLLLAFAPGAAAALDARMGAADPGPYAHVSDWFITGAYPVLTWVAVLMLGVGTVRLGVARPPVMLVAGGLGLVAMVGGLGLSISLGGDGIEAEPTVAAAGLTAAAVGTSAFTIGNVGFCVDPGSVDRLFVASPGLVSGSPLRVWPTNMPQAQHWLRTDLPGLIPYVGAGGDERDVRLWAWLAFLRKQSSFILWGGALPTVELPTAAIALGTSDRPAEGLDAALRGGRPPVLGRLLDDRLLLDCRTVLPSDVPALAARLASL